MKKGKGFKKMKKKIILTMLLILTLSLGFFTIPKEVNAMEKSELITIDAEDFTIYHNDLVADGNGNLSGTIQFRYTYNYRQLHANTNIYVGGYGLNNYMAGFKVFHNTAVEYDNFYSTRLSHNAMTFIAIDYYTEDEYPKTISPVPNGTFDIIIGDDSVNATTMEPGFPETTSKITIQLTYTIDPTEAVNSFIDYNINDSKVLNDFKFYVYESDYYDGYNDGFVFGANIGENQGYIYGYNKARQEYGYYDLVTGTWLGYDDGVAEVNDAYTDGYTAGLSETAQDAYNQGLIDGAKDNFMADLGTWIVPAIIIVLIGGGFIAFAKMRNSKE